MVKYSIIFRFLLLFVPYFFVANCSFAQEHEDINAFIEDIIEEIAADSDEELDYTTLFDDLYFYYNNPLDINEATNEELQRLYFLNNIQIYNLIAYRRNFGNLLTIYELGLIDGFDMTTIQRLLYFAKIRKTKQEEYFSWKNAMKYGNHQLFLRTQFLVEEQKGYTLPDDTSQNASKGYLGNKYKLYARYKYNYKRKILWGITAEKDQGEQFFDGEQKNGFDYYSAHFQINDVGMFKKILLGDYQVQFGQGLTMWSGMTTGKSSFVLSMKRKPQGLRKYSSTDENKFMRGLGTTIGFGDFNFSVFYSKKKIDANIIANDTIENEIEAVTSFQNTGYHRTEGEIEDKDAINETVLGANLSYHHKNFKAGFSYLYNSFGANLDKKTEPYSQFGFEGDISSNFGFDYQFLIKNITFFGEAAYSDNGGMAFINGATVPLAPQISMVLLHRHYERDYYSYYANAFGEAGSNANESGIYFGTEIHPYKYWKISAYFDSYKFAWLRYRVNAPSSGYEGFAQIDFAPNRHFKLYLRYKKEVKPQNESATDVFMRDVVDVNKESARLHLVYDISETVSFRNRLEYIKYQKGNANIDEGYMLYHDLVYKPMKIPLSLYLRYAIFDTESYDSRIYAYENDVLYAFSIPAYYYKGTRTYLTLKYTVFENLDVWFRYSRMLFSNKDIISSGLSEINGNIKSEIKFQVRYKF